MPEIIEPACTTLQSEPDNIEIIRDHIAALLAVDFAHQAELAAEAGVKSKRDYDVAVYVENENPLQYVDDEEPESNPFPCVNVSVDSSGNERGTGSVNKQSMVATIFLDAYATGNTGSSEDFGMRAGLKAWKTARLCRRILRAEKNTFFRLRGIVGNVGWKFQAFEPDSGQSAIRVRIVRITLTIPYVEDVEINEGILDWEINGIITDENGHVLVGSE
jgi:hypothetical protein